MAKLTNGIVLVKNEDGEYPPLQNVVSIDHACDICPVRKWCQDNNEFGCQVYGMFSGFYFSLDDALEMADAK